MQETESLLNNEYTQSLTEEAKSLFDLLRASQSKLIYIAILIGILIIAFKVIDLIAWIFRRRNASPLVGFLAGAAKVGAAIFFVIRVCSLFEVLSGVTTQLFMSSSLVVVVMGFVFQEGLTNIVHGFILSIAKPFKIGDRLQITVDGETITGYVRAMNLRATVIENVTNSSTVIVPNSKLDLSIIDNSYLDARRSSSNFLDVDITYDSDLERACAIIASVIDAHPLVAGEKEHLGSKDPCSVGIRELGLYGIGLRAVVLTRTIEQNFQACSDIRREIVLRFQTEPHVTFAASRTQVLTDAPHAAEAARTAAGSPLSPNGEDR